MADADITSLFAQVLADVQGSPELERVLRIPQRDPDELANLIAAPLTRRLKSPKGTMTLKPLQALGLAEAHDYGGILGLYPVGSGKTLVSLLLPTILKAERALLLVPAKLVEKTHADFAELAPHWQTRPIEVCSYELVSRRPGLLDAIRPDVIIADESHKLKNTKAAVTKRVWRYLRTYQDTQRPVRFIPLSGTMTKRSFRDWWHLQRAALPEPIQPLPAKWSEMSEWASALDTKLIEPRPLGALSRLGGRNVQEVRNSFGARLRRTPGVITQRGQDIAASIQIETFDMQHASIRAAADQMRKTWETPDGDPFSEAADLWRHSREVACGFYYKWRVPGPPEWLEARRNFHAFVRETLKHSRKLDTMLQVTNAHPDHPSVAAWRAIRDSFKPETIPHWFTDDVLAYAANWSRTNNGLVWVEQVAAGVRLEVQHGLKYFGRQGKASDGSSIRNHTGPAAVSSTAVSEGFNLQHQYHRNWVMNATPSGLLWEQLIGRTHRQGQEADTVEVTVLTNTTEQLDGFKRAVEDAAYEQDITGQVQKLCLADIVN